jgi:hypothetical protein
VDARTEREQGESTVDRLFQAWLRAEQHYREMPLGSPDAEHTRAELEQLWAAYEHELGKAIGRGTLRPKPARAGT